MVVSDSVTPWTVACQAPLLMGFFRQKHWSVLPFPPPGHLPDAGIELASSVSPPLAGGRLTLSHLGSMLVAALFVILIMENILIVYFKKCKLRNRGIFKT